MAYIQDSIMLFGDSLTQGSYDHHGLAARLAHVYARKMDVINRGFSGYNLPWGGVVFKSVFPTRQQQAQQPQIRLLVIWFGANDAVLPHKSQHVPLPAFTAELSSVISLVQDPSSEYHSSQTNIVLITPPPFSVRMRKANLDSRKPQPLPMDRTWERTQAFAEAVKTVGNDKGVPVVDCWSYIWEAADKDEIKLEGFFTDGLHLNEEGYAIVYDGLMSKIKEKFPSIYPENMQSVFPPWDEVDSHNAKSSLQLRKAEKEA